MSVVCAERRNFDFRQLATPISLAVLRCTDVSLFVVASSKIRALENHFFSVKSTKFTNLELAHFPGDALALVHLTCHHGAEKHAAPWLYTCGSSYQTNSCTRKVFALSRIRCPVQSRSVRSRFCQHIDKQLQLFAIADLHNE